MSGEDDVLSIEKSTFKIIDDESKESVNVFEEVELSKREAQRMINRSIMHRQIDIALCLAKNGKSLRGHNENTDSVSKGLFLEMVDLLKKYDSLLSEHLENGPKYASYISNRIQNVMKRNISICVRYFNKKENRPVELFVGVKRLLSVNAQSVYDSLTEAIDEIGIDWKNVIAVCFDGAATMAGSCNGVQAKIIENKHQHILCPSLWPLPQSNLASPVRLAILERISKEINLKLKSLKTLSTTRWACRSEAIEAVKNNYSALLLCLKEISNKTNLSEVRAKAKGLIFQMKTFDFIFAMHTISPVLIMIQKVSASLQSPNLDLLSAVSLV
ncbi:uncharacterized protein LOC126553354 [Aphis gossypii]|uniref:uncharacterized protein LOC126553354 n=1 Tax=Aphis gossypii TaxID=80765 RepID=UPI002159A350|nr:uncharacterized protein LOC126553354 [Aphis gossypii]